MQFAHSDLALARQGAGPGILFETLCFHAQQAAEKAIKAVLIHHGIPVVKIHSIERLVDLLPTSIQRPPILTEAALLTDYAVTFRYPGDEEPLTETEYHEAVRLAAAVVAWAEARIQE